MRARYAIASAGAAAAAFLAVYAVRSCRRRAAAREFERSLIEQCLADGMSMDEIRLWLREI